MARRQQEDSFAKLGGRIGSACNKQRFFIKPNLLRRHSSYVITDPKGTILNEVGTLLNRKGYRIKSLNLTTIFTPCRRRNLLALHGAILR